VNISTVPLLHIQLGAIAAHVKDELVIDLSLVRFLDSSGLSFLVTADEELAPVPRRPAGDLVPDASNSAFM
jgi:anti-anti-sigma regulatory factor